MTYLTPDATPNKKKILLRSIMQIICLTSLPLLAFAYDGYNFNNWIPSFTTEKTKTSKQSDISFGLGSELLVNGNTQVYGNIYEFDDATTREDLKPLLALANSLTDIFSNRPSRNLLVSKHAYIIPNSKPEQFDSSLYRDPIYTKESYPKLKYFYPERFGLKPEDVDFSWIIRTKVPGMKNAMSPAKFRSFTEQQLDTDQRAALSRIDESIKQSPVNLTISAIEDPRYEDKSDPLLLGKEHELFRGSVAISLYYPINNGQDALSIVYMIAKLNKPSFFPKKAATALFIGGIADTVNGERRYFSKP